MSHQQATISFRGTSGAQYRFYLYSWGQRFQAFGAVYLVLRHDGNNRYSVIYVGQTEDMGERFDDHHKQWCFDRNRKTHIAVLSEPSEQRRLYIERDLIQGYNPRCNGN